MTWDMLLFFVVVVVAAPFGIGLLVLLIRNYDRVHGESGTGKQLTPRVTAKHTLDPTNRTPGQLGNTVLTDASGVQPTPSQTGARRNERVSTFWILPLALITVSLGLMLLMVYGYMTMSGPK